MMRSAGQAAVGDDLGEAGIRYKDPAAYERYIIRKFECMRADGYQVEISPRLYHRATKDRKIGQWLEDNLRLLPSCVRSLEEMIVITGGRIVSCAFHLINYNNISTEVCAVDGSSEIGMLCDRMGSRSVIRTTNVSEIEEQIRYNSIFWTPEIESAGFKAKA